MTLVDWLYQVEFAAKRLNHFPLECPRFKQSPDVPLGLLDSELFPVRLQTTGNRWTVKDEIRLWSVNDHLSGPGKKCSKPARLGLFVKKRFVGIYDVAGSIDSAVTTATKMSLIRVAAKLRLPTADLSVCFWRKA